MVTVKPIKKNPMGNVGFVYFGPKVEIKSEIEEVKKTLPINEREE